MVFGLGIPRIEETSATDGTALSRGNRNRNDRLARLRVLLPTENAIMGIDLADDKQATARPGAGHMMSIPVSPSVTIISDHGELLIVWTLYGHKTRPDNRRRSQTTSVRSRESRR